MAWYLIKHRDKFILAKETELGVDWINLTQDRDQLEGDTFSS